MEHSKHMESVTIFTSKDIVDHATKLNQSLERLRKDIIEKQLILTQIIDRETVLEGDKIFALFESSKKIIEPFDKIFSSIINETILNIKSVILTEWADKNYVSRELANEKEMILEYRGSIDGYLSTDFHRKCDGVANTLSVIKTTEGNIIGGFTTIPWKETGGTEIDVDSYVFSVKHRQKMKVKNG